MASYHTHLMQHIVNWKDRVKTYIEETIFDSFTALTAIFGTDPDYAEFEEDGHLALHGDATAWDDLRFPAASQKAKGAPTPTAYKGGQVLALSKVTDQGIYFEAQTPHARKDGSDMDFHVHFALPTAGAGAGAENVKFNMTHSWADLEEAFPAETTLTATVDVQNYAADTHYLIDMGDLVGTGKGISGMVICSLERDTSVTDNYDDVVYLLEADFHYEIDSLGSRQEYVK